MIFCKIKYNKLDSSNEKKKKKRGEAEVAWKWEPGVLYAKISNKCIYYLMEGCLNKNFVEEK